MLPGADELLAAALPALYLLDCLVWLERGEVAIAADRSRIRAMGFGSDFRLAGRGPWLPNPLALHHIVVKADWKLTPPADSASDDSAVVTNLAAALRPTCLTSAGCAVLSAALAPVALLMGRSDWFLVFWVLCVLLTAAGAAFAWARLPNAQLKRPKLLWEALIGLVCLPYAGTFARRLAAHARLTVDLPAFADRHLPSERARPFNTRLAALLTAFRLEAQDGSAAASRIDTALQELNGRIT